MTLTSKKVDHKSTVQTNEIAVGKHPPGSRDCQIIYLNNIASFKRFNAAPVSERVWRGLITAKRFQILFKFSVTVCSPSKIKAVSTFSSKLL